MPKIKKVLTDFKSMGVQTMTIANRKAAWHIYTARPGQIRLKGVQYICVKGTKVYVITCSASSASFDRYRKTFGKIAQSLSLD